LTFQTSKHVRKAFPDSEAYFRVVTLAEPPKEEMMLFLDAEHKGQPVGNKPTRLATVQVFLGTKRDSDHFYELKVNVDSGEIVHKEQLVGRHPHVDGNDMVKTEAACLNDARVQAAIKDLQLPDGAVVKIEPWTYATDGMNDMSQKITMVSRPPRRKPIG
jgi:primary-amine oxidase